MYQFIIIIIIIIIMMNFTPKTKQRVKVVSEKMKCMDVTGWQTIFK